MSFWENNKDTFKSAGIATVKGIGHGTKALGKAGYKTYKNNEARRHGVDGESSTTEGSSNTYVSIPPPSTDLKSYPAPPRRNLNGPLPTDGSPAVSYNTAQQAQQQYQQPAQQPVPQQVQHQYQQPIHQQGQQQNQPPSYSAVQNSNKSVIQPIQPVQSNQPPTVQQQFQSLSITPAQQSVQQQTQELAQQFPQTASGIQLQAPVDLSSQQPSYQRTQPTAPTQTQSPAQIAMPSRLVPPTPSQSLPPSYDNLNPPQQNQASVSYESPYHAPFSEPPASIYSRSDPQILPPTITQSNYTDMESQEVPKVPCADPKSFAPPPVHKGRGKSDSPIATENKQSNLEVKTSHTSQEPPKIPTKTNLLDFNISNYGPPPPKPFRPTDDLLEANKNNSKSTRSSANTRISSPGSNISLENLSTARTPPPPPPSRSNNSQESFESHKLPPPLPGRIPSSSNSNKQFIESAPKLPQRVFSISNERNDTSSPNSLSPQTTSTSVSKISGEKSKRPPPKPLKKSVLKPENLAAEAASPFAEQNSMDSRPNLPNFAEVIAKMNLSDNSKEIYQKVLSDEALGYVKPILSLPAESAPTNSAPDKPQKKITSSFPDKQKPVVKPRPAVKPKPKFSNSGNKINESSSNASPISDDLAKNSLPHVATPPPPPPPPSRNYGHHLKQKKATEGPPILNLELTTGWFANISGPLELPQDLQGLNYSTSYEESTLGTQNGKTVSHSRYINLILKDLSYISYRINWQDGNMNQSKSEIVKFSPSPFFRNPSKAQLIEYNEKFGDYIASWCEHKMGQKVGNGECWTLAHDALLKSCGKHAFISTYKHHGYPILKVKGVETGVTFEGVASDQIRRGDILQYEKCIFFDKLTGATSTAGNPDHTSVVLDNNGDNLIIAEQNVNSVKSVVRGEVNLKNLIRGSITVYRVIPSDWVKNL